MSEFSDRVALITGASGGLGTAVTDAFLSEGATVVGVSHSGGARSAVNNFLAAASDLGSSAGAETAVQETLEKAGRLDCLVHLGGRVCRRNALCRNRRRYLGQDDKPQPAGRGSHHARGAPAHDGARLRPYCGRWCASVKAEAGLSAYGASKAALNALTQTIAEEASDAGVTANVVLPSVMDTPANRDAMPGADPSKWVKPESIARQIVWLCSAGAADTSGALILHLRTLLDGGLSPETIR